VTRSGLFRLRPLRAALVVASLLLLPVITLGGWALGVRAAGNFHEVERLQLYRSAQPGSSFLSAIIDRYGIRTIINLRGPNPGAKWYRDEIHVADSKGVTHIDIAMSAGKEPDPATINRLLEAFKTARKPILVHCQAGADRSGLASAIYELRIAHRPASQAARQLSFFYGHFPWLMSRTVAMDNAFARIAASTH
jgi:protein tyrosine/serine phosphatase